MKDLEEWLKISAQGSFVGASFLVTGRGGVACPHHRVLDWGNPIQERVYPLSAV